MAIGRLQAAFVEPRLVSLPKENAEAVQPLLYRARTEVKLGATDAPDGEEARALFFAWEEMGPLLAYAPEDPKWQAVVAMSDKGRERSVGLGGLHKHLAQDAALGLAVLRGLKEREPGRQCSELWGPSRPYKPSQWAHFGQIGWLGCEDAGLWRGMGGREAKDVKEEREGASTTTILHHPPLQAYAPPPPQERQRG